ncbi:MAG: small ribosomal subunit Rsm22 family protein [Methylocystis sp.]
MRLPSPELPAPLAAAIEAARRPRARRAARKRPAAVGALSGAQADARDDPGDETDALAYAVTRMPATYAAIVTALGRLEEECPDFAPKRMLDVGCGLGAAACAASTLWPSVAEIALLDRSALFLRLAANLMKESGAHPAIEIVEADFAEPGAIANGPFDLVIVGYALTEIADSELPSVVDRLWALAGGALVIVEPGTPRDHARLMGVRSRLTALGANIVAPCPHQAPCPLPTHDWCHFSVRLGRRRAHRLIKGADAPFEDEKFAYLAVGRSGAASLASARVIGPPRAGKREFRSSCAAIKHSARHSFPSATRRATNRSGERIGAIRCAPRRRIFDETATSEGCALFDRQPRRRGDRLLHRRLRRQAARPHALRRRAAHRPL